MQCIIQLNTLIHWKTKDSHDKIITLKVGQQSSFYAKFQETKECAMAHDNKQQKSANIL